MNVNPYAAPHAELADIRSYGDDPYDRLATRWQRLGGAIVDGIIQGVVVVPLSIVAGLNAAENAGDGRGAGALATLFPALAGATAIGIGIAGLLVLLAIDTFLLARNGQTIGKLVVGSKIVRSDGSQADVVRILLLRGLPLVLLSAPSFITAFPHLVGLLAVASLSYAASMIRLVDVLMVFRNDKRCLHDLIADTIVVAV